MTQPTYSPQPYVPAPTRKKGMPGWGWALLVGCPIMFVFFTAILAAILFPVFAQAREKARQSSCASNLKQISIQMLGYTQDYDDKFPPADHWMDVIEPYGSESKEQDSQYHCPSLRGKGSDVYGYAFNSNIALKPAEKIADLRAKILAYASSTMTRSASDPGTSRPAEGRHSKGNNISFADGHVKWFRVGSENGESGNGKPAVTP